jgi:hypothetical protein
MDQEHFIHEGLLPRDKGLRGRQRRAESLPVPPDRG